MYFSFVIDLEHPAPCKPLSTSTAFSQGSQVPPQTGGFGGEFPPRGQEPKSVPPQKFHPRFQAGRRDSTPDLRVSECF